MSVDTTHLKHCILYEFHKGRNVLEAFQSLSSIYNDVSKSFCKYWFARFRSKNFNLTSENEPDNYSIEEISDGELENDQPVNQRSFDMSFDVADYNLQAKRFGNNRINITYNPQKMCDRIKKVKRNLRINQHCVITIEKICPKPNNAFFNTVCMVVAVLRTKELDNRIFLRVMDGTVLNVLKPLNILLAERIDYSKSKFFQDQVYNYIRNYCVDILCFDEYVEKAIYCNPGDIVHLRNVRAHELDSVVSLKFNGGGKRFGRTLEILEESKYSWKFGTSESLPESIKHPQMTSSPIDSINASNNFFEEEEDIKVLPVPESVCNSPTTKKSHFAEDSFVAESPHKD